jgi:hypothetical protein
MIFFPFLSGMARMQEVQFYHIPDAPVNLSEAAKRKRQEAAVILAAQNAIAEDAAQQRAATSNLAEVEQNGQITDERMEAETAAGQKENDVGAAKDATYDEKEIIVLDNPTAMHLQAQLYQAATENPITVTQATLNVAMANVHEVATIATIHSRGDLSDAIVQAEITATRMTDQEAVNIIMGSNSDECITPDVAMAEASAMMTTPAH